MSLRTYSNHFLMLHNHTGMVVPHAFDSHWRLFSLDQIQLYAYCTMVKQHFSILCSNLNFLFCICCQFGHFSLVLFFLCVTATNHSRQTSYIIPQKDVICCSMGPLRRVVSKNEHRNETKVLMHLQQCCILSLYSICQALCSITDHWVNTQLMECPFSQRFIRHLSRKPTHFCLALSGDNE